MMRLRSSLVWLGLLWFAAPIEAQWLNLPTPGLPRLADGKPNLDAPAPRMPDGKPDLSGLWRNDAGDRYNNNIASDLGPGDVAPWADALYRKRRLDFGKDSMETRCLPLGPVLTTTRYRWRRIVQTPTMIVMLFDDLTHRVIFMDGRTLEPDPNPTWMGYSVGRWEGDVLVVDSNGYTDRSWLDFDGHPHTEALRISERFTRRNVGQIDVQVTMTDPKAYTRPITVAIPMKLQADTEMLEAVCENNAASLARMSATKPAQPVNVPAPTLARYVGMYDVADGDEKTAAEVTLTGATLWLDYGGKGREELVALSPTRFSWSGAIVEFQAPAGGVVTMLLHYAEGTEKGPKRAANASPK
ncbi:MAG TPA: hypothetical protein VM819_12335 [Vicinamibacterales bacterium]|nr:hypothetical protein [Vicinamibacterales bacterium]